MDLEELKSLLPQFVGGEAAMFLPTWGSRGTHLCGHIDGITYEEARTDCRPPRPLYIVLSFTWLAKQDGDRQGSWSEIDWPRLVHKMPALVPTPDSEGKLYNAPPFKLQEGHDGARYLFYTDWYTERTCVIYMPDGRKLDPATVTWLPNGPRARSLR